MTPLKMQATPASCKSEGDSLKRTTPRITEPTGCIVNRTDVSAAGSRGSDNEISSQPTTCELRASSTSHPCDGHDGTRSMSPMTSPATSENTAAAAVASNN